jgi:hypothetical protein
MTPMMTRLMVFRFSAQHLLLLASLAVGCGPEFQASFSPLGEAGAPADDGNGPSANVSGQPATNGGAAALAGGSAGSVGSSAGSVGGTGQGGASGSAGSVGGTAQGGACARRCDALEPWAGRSYTLGERVSSICKAPYNGACAANTQHEFECQPPTGVVGLGWCSVRQPGVGNGWHEAWRISAACE